MSGAEVIGLVASVSQLVQYATRLVSLLQEICQGAARSAEQYQRHQQQVDQVLRIAHLIANTEGLGTELVLFHVQSLTATTQTLQSAIERSVWYISPSKKLKKCLKVLEFPKAQDAIVKGFDNLEREKSCLSLCLLGEFGNIILQIQTSLDALPSIQEQVGSIQQSLQGSPEIAEESRRVEQGSASAICEHCSMCNCQDKIPKDTRPFHLIRLGAYYVQGQANALPYRLCSSSWDSHAVSGEMTSDTKQNGAETPSRETRYDENDDGSTTLYGADAAVSLPVDGRSYSGMASFDEASQLNGDWGGHAGHYTTGYSTWERCQATGKSNQVNGDILDSRFAVGFFWPRG